MTDQKQFLDAVAVVCERLGWGHSKQCPFWSIVINNELFMLSQDRALAEATMLHLVPAMESRLYEMDHDAADKTVGWYNLNGQIDWQAHEAYGSPGEMLQALWITAAEALGDE